MNIRRVISVYELIGDKLIKEISIDNISIVELRAILNIDNNDLEIHHIYPISHEQRECLIDIIPELLEFNIESVGLYVECFQN